MRISYHDGGDTDPSVILASVLRLPIQKTLVSCLSISKRLVNGITPGGYSSANNVIISLAKWPVSSDVQDDASILT